MTPDGNQIFGVALTAMWATAGACGLYHAYRQSKVARDLSAAVKRMKVPMKAVCLAGLIAVVAIGGSKPGGNGPNRILSHRIAVETVVENVPFTLTEANTNVTLVVRSEESVVSRDGLLLGASESGEWVEFDHSVFTFGTNEISRVYASPGVLSFETKRHPALGSTLPYGDNVKSLVAFRMPLGLVPQANWQYLSAPCRFWHEETDRSVVFTWENILLDRQADQPATIQIELEKSGAFTYRYDFSRAVPTNAFLIGAQHGGAAITAFRSSGGAGGSPAITNSATVYRVQGASVTDGVSVADLLAASPTLELRWENVAGLGDLSGDTDGDGLSDWDEIHLHGTDPRHADTDGDGLSDSAEILAGTNPIDADEDGDGVPDGVDEDAWAGNALWGSAAGATNLVITLTADISAERNATLVLDTLSIPLRAAQSYPLHIEPGQVVPFRLFSTGAGVVPLRIETGSTPARVRANGPRKSPQNPIPVFPIVPLWVEDPNGVFDPNAAWGSGRFAYPVLRLLDEDGRDYDFDMCRHNGATTADWTVQILPLDIGLDADDLELDGFVKKDANTLSLSLGPNPSYPKEVYGTATLCPPVLYAGTLSEARRMHRCRGAWSRPECHVCGFPHDPSYGCAHADDCAAVLDPTADCTCTHFYVRVAWPDSDGNGVRDCDELQLVGDAGNLTFHGFGYGGDGCCCWGAYEYRHPFAVRLVSHSSNLRVFDASGTLMSNGATTTLFTVQASEPSPKVGGSEVAYDLLDATNGVLRTLHVPITAWDLFDTGIAFNWATNDHAADAINLRRTFTNSIDYTQPEWKKDKIHTGPPSQSEPACWIAGTTPTIKARFQVEPADITNAVLTADFSGDVLSWIDNTNVAFTKGVTHSAAPFPDHEAFTLQNPIPTMVARGTNEVWRWYAKEINGHPLGTPVFVATNGPSVAYSILDAPVAPWTDAALSDQNVWASALDFVTQPNVCGGTQDMGDSLSNLTSFLFSGHGLVYDVIEGGSSYILWRAMDDISFHLGSYLKKTRGSVVNCYDQACSLTLLGRCMGVDVEPIWMEPFGYIQTTTLVGDIPSNNPFFGNPIYFDSNPVCPINEPRRSGFGNHMFTRFDNHIFDACAGPATGQWTLPGYLAHVIDRKTSNAFFATGDTSGATTYSGIKEIIE